MKATRIGLVASVAIAMVTLSSVWGATTTTTPLPQLVANLLNPKGQSAGQAGYGQQTEKSGKITASFLNVKVGPLPNSLVGTELHFKVDSVIVGAAKVTAGKGDNSAHAELDLNSANKQKVPAVRPGSLITISVSDKPLAQGTFMALKK